MAATSPVNASLFKWSERVVVIYTDNTDNTMLGDQRKKLLKDRVALADRDMVVFAVFANGAVESIFGTAPTPAQAKRLPGRPGDNGVFSVALIGKDGGLKHSWSSPIEADVVFGMVDAMPMRRQETRSKRPG